MLSMLGNSQDGVMWKLPFPWPLPLCDLDLGKWKGTEWWARIPIISKGPKTPTWLRKEAGKGCPASMKYSHLAEERLQSQTQFLKVLKHCLNRKVCM